MLTDVMREGSDEGDAVGINVGSCVGLEVVGSLVGLPVTGNLVGSVVGAGVGRLVLPANVGATVTGLFVGLVLVGNRLGSVVGNGVGRNDGFVVGVAEGRAVGT